MKSQFTLIALILAITACTLLTGCEKNKPARLPMLFDGDVILAFGDSLTFGTGSSSGNNYPQLLSAKIGYKVINAGVPGETTAEGLRRLPGAIAKHRPALVLLCLGGNDFLKKTPTRNTSSNLNTMLDILSSEGIPVVLIAVPRPGLSLKAEPLYSKLATQHEVALLEGLFADVLGKTSLKSDPIHPNNEGYRRVAAGIAEFLKARGAI